MGVAGLWQLLDPTGRPVRLETLEGKILAIDISIWLNQLVKGYRASGGVGLDNAYLVGLFQRVCKLLHFKIRPVFVFDGEAPALKYQTLATRKRRREDGDEAIRAATKKMLQTYVQQKLLGEANAKLPKLKPSRRQQADEELFRLPEVSHPLSNSDDSSLSDSAVDVARDADLSSIKIDSEEFKSLPLNMQHEFLVAIKNREKRGAVDVDELPADSDDFSTYQMSQVLKKRSLQSRIEEMQRQMNDGLLRVASDAAVKVVLNVTPAQTSVGRVKNEDEEDDDGAGNDEDDDGNSPSKKAKLEDGPDEGGLAEANGEPTKEKRVENFLVSQWLEGAQRGEESNETLKKAVELVRDEVDIISDSGASSDEAEVGLPSEARKRLLSTGGKVGADEVMGAPPPPGVAGETTSRDSVLSDGLSMEVGHGSIVSASASRVMLPEEQFDEGSRQGPPSTSEDDEVVAEEEDNANGGSRPQPLVEDSNTEHTCNTDMLNADLEVSETANSVFRMGDTAERSMSHEVEEDEAAGSGGGPATADASSLLSSQSCKLTEVKGSPVIKEVSFLGGTQSSLNSNDDIVLPHNLSRIASKDPSRCGSSNSLGFVPGTLAGAAGATTGPATLADSNPTDFHQALEIIREQERRQSESVGDAGSGQDGPDSGQDGLDSCKDSTSSAAPIDRSRDLAGGDEVASTIEEPAKESNNNVEVKKPSPVESSDDKQTTEVTPMSNGDAVGSSQADLIEKPEETGKVDAEGQEKEEEPKQAITTTLLDIVSPEFVAKQKQALETQSQALQNEINRLQRQTAEVTTTMADNCAELLQMFGIPCVRAPREAEAQCAALEQAGLVQGIVTDDSDIFLFGGQTVYKNLFSQNAHCEMYTAKTIETRLKLGRGDLIGFAMLTGSDYTNGVENVGPVTACEILAEFRSGCGDAAGKKRDAVLTALRDFKAWWSLAQKGAVPPVNSVRTRFVKLRLDEKFPSEVVFNAYDKPTVDSMKDKFTWSRPDLDLLRKFTAAKFNWTQEKTDGYLLPILKKYEDRSAQPRIDGFLLPSIQKRENLFPSKRLKAAVGKIRAPVGQPKQEPQAEANLSESSSDEYD